MTIATRKPSGKPPWPLLLIAGPEKVGKSYAAAAASASEHIGRTFWFPVGEDAPDEYGALPGARFEIVEYDGTYRALLNLIQAASREPADDGKPNMLVIDSASRVWSLLSDMAQAEQVMRNRRKKKRQADTDDAKVDMDLWNVAKQRWQHILFALKEHPGPVILTARLEFTTVMENGQPTKEKAWKVQAEKSLPHDVDAIVQIRSYNDPYLTGVRSLRYRPEPAEVTPYPDFTVEKLWTDLGVTEKDATAPRATDSPDVAAQSVSAEERRDELLAQILELTRGNPGKVVAAWLEAHGHPINETHDLAALAEVVEQLRGAK